MKGNGLSAALGYPDNTPKRVDIQTCIIPYLPMSLRNFFLLLGLLCIAGCTSEPRRAEALIARASTSEFGVGTYGCADTIEAAAKAGVDYERAVDGAMQRKEKSLHTLFWLTSNAGFDGAESEGHAAVLGTVLRYVGDGTFGAALSAEPVSTREAVQDDLRYDFGGGKGGKEDWLIEWYPLTFATGGQITRSLQKGVNP
jgi:hypothetical protein